MRLGLITLGLKKVWEQRKGSGKFLSVPLQMFLLLRRNGTGSVTSNFGKVRISCRFMHLYFVANFLFVFICTINYAIYEELDVGDVEWTREVYKYANLLFLYIYLSKTFDAT